MRPSLVQQPLLSSLVTIQWNELALRRCELLRRLLLAPIPCTRDVPLIAIAQDRRRHPFPTFHVSPFPALFLEFLFLRAVQPVQAVLRFTYCVLESDREGEGNQSRYAPTVAVETAEAQGHFSTGSHAHNIAG